MPSNWNSGLFSFKDIKEDDPKDTICSFCCPNCASAVVYSRFNDSPCLFNFFCRSIAANRKDIRESYGIKGHWFKDCIASFCCSCCVTRQLIHEVKRQGKTIDYAGPVRQSFLDIKTISIEMKDKAKEKVPKKEEAETR